MTHKNEQKRTHKPGKVQSRALSGQQQNGFKARRLSRHFSEFFAIPESMTGNTPDKFI